MATVDLRVELPAQSQSFTAQVQHHWSVKDIKEEIQRVCPGSPQVNGQRIIWRGRILRDEERVQDLWKSPDDARIVHLAVHPSAWTSNPAASVQAIPSSQPIPQPASQPLRRDSPTSARVQAPPQPMPIPYILNKHNAALHVLTNGNLPSEPEPSNTSQLRTQAVSVLQMCGYSWPTVLDEEYPQSDSSNNGVKYERIVIDNQPFLRLETPNATPTPMQRHALKVLSHTFPLLSIPVFEPTPYPTLPFSPSYALTPPTNINQHLQQLGLPPLRMAPTPNQPDVNDPNNAVAAEIRAIPLRALLGPLMMLTFRTFLLVYFFSPSKRPVFGILLSVWILYETWGALRVVLGNERQPAGQGAGQARADPAPNGDQAANPQRAQGPAGGVGVGNSQSTSRSSSDIVLDYLANMDLSSEDAIIDSGLPASEPSMARKVKSFVILMVTTLHPAVWDRRRTVLRRREGRLRTEANIRESEPPSEGNEDAERANARARVIARHERRPQWVRSYIDRVQNTEWVDDM